MKLSENQLNLLRKVAAYNKEVDDGYWSTKPNEINSINNLIDKGLIKFKPERNSATGSINSGNFATKKGTDLLKKLQNQEDMAKKKSKSKPMKRASSGGSKMIKDETTGAYFAQWYDNYPIMRHEKSLAKKYSDSASAQKDLKRLKSKRKDHRIKIIG